MIYTIKDEKGNMICSIENVDPTKSAEMSGWGKAGIIIGSYIGLCLGVFGVKSVINKINTNKITKLLGEEKLKYANNYIDSSFKQIIDSLYKFSNQNRTLFPQLTKTKFYTDFDNNDKTSNIKLIKSILKNKSFDKICFEIDLDAFYKYADLKKLGITYDDICLNKTVEDRLEKMHDNALKDYEKWVNKTIKDIKSSPEFSNGCKIVSISCDHNEDDGDDINARNCEYVITSRIMVTLKHSSEFIEKIIKPIKDATNKTK